MITPSGLTVAVRRARRTTAAGEGLRAVRGRLGARGLAGAELCQPPSLTALRQPWRDLAIGDIDLTVLVRALDPASPVEVGQQIPRKPDSRVSSAGTASGREAIADGGLRQRAWSGPGSGVIRDTPAPAASAVTPGERSELLARQGSRLPDDVPDVTSDAPGSDAVEGAPTTSSHPAIDPVDLQPVPVGQLAQGSDAATRPDTADRSDLGRGGYGGQSGLGELLRRWEDVQPDDTATTFPGTKPIPVRSPGTTPPVRATDAIPPNFGRPEATPSSVGRPGDTPPNAAPFDPSSANPSPFDATSVDSAPFDDTRLGANRVGATPLDATRMGATPFAANPLGSTPAGGTPSGTHRTGGGPEFSEPDRAVHSWPPAALAPTDLLGDLEDVVEEALEALVLREVERYGLDAGAP